MLADKSPPPTGTEKSSVPDSVHLGVFWIRRKRATSIGCAREPGVGFPLEIDAWAIVGMNVFLGLRYGVWSEDRSTAEVAATATRLLREGLAPR